MKRLLMAHFKEMQPMLPVLIDCIPPKIRSAGLTAHIADITLTRRRTVSVFSALLAISVGSGTPRARAWAQANLSAASFMRKVGEELSAIIGGDTSKAEKQQRLQSLIDQSVAVNEIARFCLGRFWRQASPSQQRQYLHLFHSVLVREVVVRLGDYKQEEVHVIVGRPERNGDAMDVPSTVERTGEPPAKVTWVLHEDNGSFKIFDMLAEGVSMRLTVRSDYDSFLTNHDDSVEALLSALNRQAQS